MASKPLFAFVGLLLLLWGCSPGATQPGTQATVDARVQATVTALQNAPGASPTQAAEAANATSTPAATPVPGVGDTVSKGNWSYTVSRVAKPGRTINTGNQFTPLNAIGTWVQVYMTLTNLGNQNFGINESDFQLQTDSGTTYNVTDQVGMRTWLSNSKLQTLGRQIPPGVSFDTGLLFDVAPEATGLQLKLRQANVSIDLGTNQASSAIAADNSRPSGTAGPAASPTAGVITRSSDPALQSAIAVVASKGYTARLPTSPDDFARYQLRVLIGTATGSADGSDQRAFFFLGDRYLGTDTLNPSAAISIDAQSATTVTLRYALFRPNDPRCCPSGGTATVRFNWTGERLNPLDAIPSDDPQAALSRR